MPIASHILPLKSVRVGAGVYDIMQLFQADPDCSFVPVVNQYDEPLGIVHERALREYTFAMFGRELLKRKSIPDFLSACPIVSYATEFHELIQTPTFQHRDDGFLIIKDGVYAGFLPVSSLLTMYEEHRNKVSIQLFQAQKLESIGVLAGGIAHDFNNILASIGGYLGLVRMQLVAPDAKVLKHLDTVEQLTFRAADLTKQLLGFARGGKYQVQPCNANEVVLHVLQIARQTFDRSIEFTEELAPALKIVKADRGQLEQVLLNLLINARDAMPGGGRLSIRSWNLDPAREHAFHELDGHRSGGIAVCVSDTGIGIPTEIQRRIFEPFFSTKETGKGSGMGLAMSYGIIKNHGGRIEVESEPGKGASFTLYLPSSSDEAPSPPEPLPASRELPEPFLANIIVVDDDASVLEMIGEYLKMTGFTVSAFSDGHEALSFFGEQSRSTDIVLLDMIMPRISGQQVFHELRSIDPGVRVLFMSGYNESENVQQLLAHDHTGFIQKPFSFSNLQAAMSDLLANSEKILVATPG